MNQVQLVLAVDVGSHPGLSAEALAHTCDLTLQPLLDALELHPSVHLALHLSGAVLDTVRDTRPEQLETLRQLVARSQIEILGGGFYDPLLFALPDADAHGQLAFTQSSCQELLGATPTGIWSTEHLYEPELPRLLGPAGLKFAFADDDAFRAAGIPTESQLGYFVTERAGQTLALFAAQRALGARLGQGSVDEVIAALVSPGQAPAHPAGTGIFLAESAQSLLASGPSWLSSFFKAISEQRDRIDPLTPSEYLSRFPARGPVYLSSAGPESMRSGSHWARLPEARQLRIRMLHSSKKLREAEAEVEADPGDGSSSEILAEARRSLYRGQAADRPDTVIADPILRAATYRALVGCEAQVDTALRGEGDFIEYEEDDFDADLRDEALLANAQLSAFVDPEDGGTLMEFDYKPKASCLTHALSADGRLRLGFRDRFHADGFGLEGLDDKATDLGDVGDFARKPYVVEASGVDEEGDLSASLTLMREALVQTQSGPRMILVEKTYRLPIDAPRFEVEYIIENGGNEPLSLTFAPELCFAHLLGTNEKRYLELADGKTLRPVARENLGRLGALNLVDEEQSLQLNLSADAEGEVWLSPVQDASGRAQGLCLFWRLAFGLPPGESRRVRFTLEVAEIAAESEVAEPSEPAQPVESAEPNESNESSESNESAESAEPSSSSTEPSTAETDAKTDDEPETSG
jgi:alpha-amylase